MCDANGSVATRRRSSASDVMNLLMTSSEAKGRSFSRTRDTSWFPQYEDSSPLAQWVISLSGGLFNCDLIALWYLDETSNVT